MPGDNRIDLLQSTSYSGRDCHALCPPPLMMLRNSGLSQVSVCRQWSVKHASHLGVLGVAKKIVLVGTEETWFAYEFNRKATSPFLPREV